MHGKGFIIQCAALLVYRKLESLQDSLSEAKNDAEKLQELLQRANEDHKTELSALSGQHEKTTSELKIAADELVCAYSWYFK